MRFLGRVVLPALALGMLAAPLTPRPATSQNTSPIPWERGPVTADLGGFAEIKIPEGFLFTGKAGTAKLLELTHNLVGGREVGAIVPVGNEPENQWFVVFEFSDVGFVKDDEKGSINADALLKSIREGTEEANKELKKKGWQTVTVTGWARPPYYDEATHNLTWAIRGQSDSGSVINHSVRILGRRGTMNVDLVLDPAMYDRTVPRFESVMSGLQFKQGSRYADFVKGDKVAAYGLSALILGGVGAAAVKTGLLAKSWKLLVGLLFALKKLLIVVFLGVAAFFKRVAAWIRARFAPKDETISSSPEGPSPPTA